jgi:hypothetical protein
MAVSCWQTARAAVGRPALDLLEHRYRRLPVDREADEGFVALRGVVRRDGRWLALDRRVWLDPGSAVMLVEDDRIEGQPAYALGRLSRAADVRGSFTSYRETPRLPVLADGWLLDVAGWTYYRASPIGRVLYRLLGMVAGFFDAARQALGERGRWRGGHWRAGVLTLVCLVALLLLASGVMVIQVKTDFVQKIHALYGGRSVAGIRLDKATDRTRPAVLWSGASATGSPSHDDQHVKHKPRSQTTSVSLDGFARPGTCRR